MNKKKKNNIFLNILAILFIVYMGLFIANLSGYYESKIRDNVIMTEEGIKEFENKVSNGEEIDVTSFLKNEREDYSNKMSNLGDKLTYGVEKFIVKSVHIFGDIMKSLF